MRSVLVLALATACSSSPASDPPDAGSDAAGDDAQPGVCSTRISYGTTWLKPAQHPGTDLAMADVTWDGTCVDDGDNSYAVLSNGWKPYFRGHSACEIALDHSSACGAPPTCSTRITYGSAWRKPAAHTTAFDDVDGRVSRVRPRRSVRTPRPPRRSSSPAVSGSAPATAPSSTVPAATAIWSITRGARAWSTVPATVAW